MKTENQSFGANFILLGLFHNDQMNTSLFIVIIIFFPMALIENIILIHLIRMDTPMYFLLCQLSFIDMMYISTSVPKMAANFLLNTNIITFLGCGIQTFLFLVPGGTEGLLLGFMSYDRYVAICYPLHYPVLMSKTTCLSRVICAWTSSTSNAFIHTLYVSQLPFCSSQPITHFFCEIPSLLLLVCQDTSQYEYTILFSGFSSWHGLVLKDIMVIVTSYAQVLMVVYNLSSSKRQAIAVSTCSSYLIVATLFYGTGISTYMRPHFLNNTEQDKVVAVFYSIITPFLNPFIYSLRNKEVIGAMKRLMR
ncbi:olfactory receptor 2AK2-like [Rhynchocyon petersi]